MVGHNKWTMWTNTSRKCHCTVKYNQIQSWQAFFIQFLWFKITQKKRNITSQEIKARKSKATYRYQCKTSCCKTDEYHIISQIEHKEQPKKWYYKDTIEDHPQDQPGPWVSNIVLATKPDDGIRFTLDAPEVNKYIITTNANNYQDRKTLKLNILQNGF